MRVRMGRKTFVAFGMAEDMASAFGVSRSWLSNAANRSRKLRGLNVFSIDGEVGFDVAVDVLARSAVSAISPEARGRLRRLLKEALDGC